MLDLLWQLALKSDFKKNLDQFNPLGWGVLWKWKINDENLSHWQGNVLNANRIIAPSLNLYPCLFLCLRQFSPISLYMWCWWLFDSVFPLVWHVNTVESQCGFLMKVWVKQWKLTYKVEQTLSPIRDIQRLFKNVWLIGRSQNNLLQSYCVCARVYIKIDEHVLWDSTSWTYLQLYNMEKSVLTASSAAASEMRVCTAQIQRVLENGLKASDTAGDHWASAQIQDCTMCAAHSTLLTAERLK